MRRTLPRQSARWWLVAGLLLCPLVAEAHTSVKGMGDFIGGMLHPVITPAHLLLIVGLGLLAGRRSPSDLKWPMALFIPFSALALGLTGLGVKGVHPVLLHGVALAAGSLLALEKDPKIPGTCALFAVAALALGFDSGVEDGSSVMRIKTLMGTWLSLTVLVYDVALYASLGAQTRWVKVALRIAGAWLVAISLMMLAFALRPPK